MFDLLRMSYVRFGQARSPDLTSSNPTWRDFPSQLELLCTQISLFFLTAFKFNFEIGSKPHKSYDQVCEPLP